jgi:phospholipid/cholesterol/gamma-HCH transport system substrate-binding protein
MNRSLAVGATVAGLCAAGVGIGFAAPRVTGPELHKLTVTFPSASGLVAGSDVLEAGSKVGTIYSIEPIQGDEVRVVVQIEGDHWPMHRGLSADIRPKSLLGEKYVDLHDGSSKGPAYDPNQVLHAPAESVPVELDQFVNSLDTDTRSALRVLLNDLGAGVAGHGVDLNQAIKTGRDDLAHLAVTGKTLNNRDPDLDRILVGLDGLFQKLTTDDQLTQMSQLIDNGKKTLDAVEAEQASFSRSFADAELALQEANTSFDTVVANLRRTLDVAPALLSNVNDEANLLAFAGKATLAPGSPDGQFSCGSHGCQVDLLAHSILGGAYTTGGAQEWRYDANGNLMDVLPIFRVCLATPDNSNANPTPIKTQGCTGTAGQTAATVQGAYSGGATDVATLADWLGV